MVFGKIWTTFNLYMSIFIVESYESTMFSLVINCHDSKPIMKVVIHLHIYAHTLFTVAAAVRVTLVQNNIVVFWLLEQS